MMISDLPIELQSKIMFYTLEHPCARMIKSRIIMKFLKHKYHDYYGQDYDDIIQNNNLGINLLKQLFYRRMKKMRERQLETYEIDDYEKICRCNIIYSPTEIEREWKHKYTQKKSEIFLKDYDEFINNQFYCHIFGLHLYIFGFREYEDIKADEYNYSVNKHIEKQIMKHRNDDNRNYDDSDIEDEYEDEDEDEDDTEDEDDSEP